jgi:hypothetical protein
MLACYSTPKGVTYYSRKPHSHAAITSLQKERTSSKNSRHCLVKRNIDDEQIKSEIKKIALLSNQWEEIKCNLSKCSSSQFKSIHSRAQEDSTCDVSNEDTSVQPIRKFNTNQNYKSHNYPLVKRNGNSGVYISHEGRMNKLYGIAHLLKTRNMKLLSEYNSECPHTATFSSSVHNVYQSVNEETEFSTTEN